ncbi:MAG TPA: hypothetical protein PKC28_10555 [Bdellovibrionales bacterium]|nr:hypothetical protein [Bdellovibrionales bacterium]
MGIEKLIPLAVAMAVTAAASGRLPQIIREVQIAQYKLLKESQSSKWGKAMLLPVRGTKTATKNR